uniref:Secreted protein n=1 Tax=Caenorhabditis tropicalis TaxID=1561998 RepID=A0A1I7TZZ8_9PELO
MSGISKLFKLPTPGVSKSATKTSLNTTTTTSSVDPNCAYVARQKYIRDRRLVTRTDVRNRMSVWVRLFAWCRGGDNSDQENESIFTIRS